MLSFVLLMILSFSSSTIIDSSSTTVVDDCKYDRLLRCQPHYNYDRARFFSFSNTVQITNSSDGSVLEQDVTQTGGSNDLGKYYREDGSRIADDYCQKPYDVLFSQCE